MGKQSKRIKPLKTKPVYEPGVAESVGIISFTRVQALMRVLDTAIWLWILEKDPAAIHILVMSQYQCLEDICKKRNVTGLFASKVTDYRQRNLVYDFLRHASNNTEGGVDFVPHVNGGYLYDAVATFRELFGVGTAYMKAFVAYFGLFFARDDPEFRHTAEQELPKGITVADFRSLSQREFFDKCVKAVLDNESRTSHIESP